jgi:hypothetical protein
MECYHRNWRLGILSARNKESTRSRLTHGCMMTRDEPVVHARRVFFEPSYGSHGGNDGGMSPDYRRTSNLHPFQRASAFSSSISCEFLIEKPFPVTRQ